MKIPILSKERSISMEQWNDTVMKATQYKDCLKGKRITASVDEREMGIDIKIGDGLTVDGLVSCLLYTNFTDLQRKFSGSTRRYSADQHKTDRDIRIEHYRQYFHWGKMLMVTIKCYGETMKSKNVFYHGINIQLVFGDFIAYFNCPTSTTVSLSVAHSFASGVEESRGIILKLSGRVKERSRTKFMNVSWYVHIDQTIHPMIQTCV